MNDFKSKLTINHPSLIDKKKKKGGDGYKKKRRENKIYFSCFLEIPQFLHVILL